MPKVTAALIDESMDPSRHIKPTCQKIVRIGRERFMALPVPLKGISINRQGPPSFVTVISLSEECLSVTDDYLRDVITNYKATDDVFCDAFLTGVIFTGPANVDITPGANDFLHSMSTTWIEVMDLRNVTSPPAPGPYFAHGKHIYEIWRLYDDSQGAFMTSLIPGPNQSQLSELRICGEDAQCISVAVPSRLTGRETPSNRLSGLRVAVKDIFHVRGLRTSVCNKAYYSLYPAALKTAACVQILEKEGAHILGTTKLAAFAATEEPIECVDYQAPWNPRADGYQSPAGSSSGSGAAIASYPWLDISIGSDTSGSGRRPGHWNGCFAMRPSHGVLPVEGYIPSFKQFDVPTFFGRDIVKCREFAEVWYGKELPEARISLPPSIVYATDYVSLITNKDQVEIINAFTADLESSLGVKHERVSFNALWDIAPPVEAEGASLQEFMKDACRNSFFHDDYHSFDRFREDYQHKFSKSPYVSPPVRWQWELSASITKAERDVAVERLAIYGKWFSDSVLKSETNDTIVIIPIEDMSPRYRDEPLGRYFNPVGVPMLFLSPILKAPELVVPAGQVPFASKVSGRVEHLPVAVSLLASPGRDLELLDLTKVCLERAGRPTSVRTGSQMFA